MTKNNRFAFLFLLALCSTTDHTVSHGFHHESLFFSPRLPYSHYSPGPQNWPNPNFSPPSSAYSRVTEHHHHPFVPSAHGPFDPYDPPNRWHYLQHDSPDFHHHSPYYKVRPHHPHFLPDTYGLQNSHDPFYHHRRSAVKTLHLDEGDFCRRGHGLYPDYLCVNAKNCSEPLTKSVRYDNHLDICSFDGIEPIVCCPTSTGKTPTFSHDKMPNNKKLLTKPPAYFVRPSVQNTATVPGAKTQDVDRASSTPPTDLIQPSLEEVTVADQDNNAPDVNDMAEPSTVPETDQNSDALSNSENFPSEIPDVDDTQETKTKTMTPIVVAQSPPIDEMTPIPDPDKNQFSDETTSKPSIEEATTNLDSDTFSGDDKISSDTLGATLPPTKVSVADSDTNDQDIEKIFAEKTPEGFKPPTKATEMDPDSNVVSPFDDPIIQPSIEETVVNPDADEQVGDSQNLNIATRKCRQYTAMDYPKDVNNFDKITSGTDPARSYNYPHMAIIGYGKTVKDKNEWKCGGSLISEKWILTAAHCYKIGSLARWVRLGVEYSPGILDIRSSEADDRTKDYQIIQHVLHPSYRKSARYNDIALFFLEKNVEFSAYVRPICLNSDPLLNPSKPISASWGETSTGERQSGVLLETTLEIIPQTKCKQSYSAISDPKVRFGIQLDSMICASSPSDDGITCSGISGGPLQEENVENPDSYTLFGVTSFCGTQEYPGVYTRISKYIPWIEEVVWSNN